MSPKASVLILSFILLVGAAAADPSWDRSPLQGNDGLSNLLTLYGEMEESGGLSNDQISTFLSLYSCRTEGVKSVGECMSQAASSVVHVREFVSLSAVPFNDRNLHEEAGAPSRPSELTSSGAGSNFEWNYLERTSQCNQANGGTGFRKGLRDSKRYYYCQSNSGGDNYLWEASRVCENGFPPSSVSEIRCADAANFEIELEEGQHTVVPDAGFRLNTQRDSDFRGVSDQGVLEDVSPGRQYFFGLRRESDGDFERIRLQAPSAELSADRFVRFGSDLDVDIESADGGSSSEYSKINTVSFSTSGGDRVSTSGSLEDATGAPSRAAVSSVSEPGLYQVEASLTDNTPGDGITATERLPVYVGNDLAADYSDFGSPYTENPDIIKEDWNVWDGGQRRDFWFEEKPDVDDLCENYLFCDITNPEVVEDVYYSSRRGSEVSLRLATNNEYTFTVDAWNGDAQDLRRQFTYHKAGDSYDGHDLRKTSSTKINRSAPSSDFSMVFRAKQEDAESDAYATVQSETGDVAELPVSSNEYRTYRVDVDDRSVVLKQSGSEFPDWESAQVVKTAEIDSEPSSYGFRIDSSGAFGQEREMYIDWVVGFTQKPYSWDEEAAPASLETGSNYRFAYSVTSASDDLAEATIRLERRKVGAQSGWNTVAERENGCVGDPGFCRVPQGGTLSWTPDSPGEYIHRATVSGESFSSSRTWSYTVN